MTATDSSTGRPPRDFVGTVVHVVDVLRSFDADHPQMTLSEVSKRTNLDRAGARRYLLSLAHLGYVIQEGKLFRLSPKVLALGFAYLSGMPIAKIAQSYLDELMRRTAQTCAVAILDGDEIVHIARAMPNRILAPTVTLGRRFPALSVSSGRVLVAFKAPKERDDYVRDLAIDHLGWRDVKSKARLSAELTAIRKRGYAIADQEFEAGVRAIAVPILKDGSAVAALNMLTNVSTVTKKQLIDEFLPLIRQAATEMQAASATV